MAEESVVGSVRAYLRALEIKGTPVRFGVLFGSHAKGQPNEWSDIDLVVVSPKFDGPYSREDVHGLWHLAGKMDERIEPIPCGEAEWREDDSNPIIAIARKEGEIVEIG